MRRDTRRTGVFTRRALLLMGGQMALLGGLGARLYQVQISESARYRMLSDQNRISARMVAPTRGRILDRFGVVVAGNKMNWRAVLVAEQTDSIDATLDAFSQLVPLDDHQRERIVREVHQHRRFIPVLVRDFLTWQQMAEIEVNAPDLPGILVDAGTSRIYPFGDQLAHVVGYVAPPSEADVATDPLLALPGMRVGRAGVEKYHDLALRGHAGVVQLEVNAYGRVIRELDRQDGVPGETVGLTIDSELQQMVANRLGDESASAVVLDCRNGEVLAMATTPSFDPGLFDTGVPQAQWAEWSSNERRPLLNKATEGLYAPGSTFKMAVAMAALHAGSLKPSDRIFCPGYLDVGNVRFHCWRKGGHGSLDLHGAIQQSCDVFFYTTALHTGIDPIAAMAHRFSLGTKLDFDLPGQATGLVPTRRWRVSQGHPWELGETAIAGIGQGFVTVTPLQLATYVARVATGRLIQPHVTRTMAGVAQPGADPLDWPLMEVEDRWLDQVRGAMWAVVNTPLGTAYNARLPDPRWHMAGKTGSAQVTDISRLQRENKSFDSAKLPWKFRSNALFVAYAPYSDPRYAISVVVEHGDEGAAAAAPIARDVMMNVLQRDPVNRTQPPPQRVAETTE